jgi:TRAP-type C4-dicarboxylate transport system permease small subunit
MMKKMISRIITGLGLAEAGIPGVCLCLVALLITVESVLRYALAEAILGLEEFTLILGLYTYFVGSAMASRGGVQIRVSIIDNIPLAPRIRQYINRSMYFWSLVVCGIYAYFAFTYVSWSVERQITILPLYWPEWIRNLSLLLGLVLMTIHHIVIFGRDLLKRETPA